MNGKLRDDETKGEDVVAIGQGASSEQGTALPSLESFHLRPPQPPTTAEPGGEGDGKNLAALMGCDRRGLGKNPMH